MTVSVALDNSEWEFLVRRPPAAAILDYLLECWLAYEAIYAGKGTPLASRTEPQLTEGLGAYLTSLQESGLQPFDGEFYAERKKVDLGQDGKRIIISRSDIEWRLFGAPNFVVEFKIIGGGRPAKAYVDDGIARFVAGRYAPKSVEGAMWAFFRPGSAEVETHVEALIDSRLGELNCQAEGGCHRIAPSTIAPSTARFDSIHSRQPQWPTIRLAHVFVWISPESEPADIK